MFGNGSLSLVCFLCIIQALPILSKATLNACDGYKCLRQLERREINELDDVCRNNNIGLDRFCYCCGGVTHYHIYGNICNRYCLKLFNRETISFSKPCQLTNEKEVEIRKRNAGNNIDEPFPNTPEKMELEYIQCKNSDDESPKTYEDFVKGSPTQKWAQIGGVDVLLEGEPNLLAKSVHDFTQAMLGQLLNSEKNKNENFAFSPFSLHVTLAMLTSAASDNTTTQSELLKALGRVQNIETISEMYADLLEEYEENQNLITFGNGVWTKKSFFNQLTNEFLEVLDENYLAHFEFLGSDPVSQINDWVKTSTRGKIDKLVDDIPDEVELLLTNTLYFKDAWTKPFEKMPLDIERKFTLINGTEIDVTAQTMYRDSPDFLLITNLTLDGLNTDFRFTVLSIPYNSLDRRFEMVIMMPEDRRGLAVLGDFLEKQSFVSTTNKNENIFDQVTNHVELARKRGRTDVDVEMPSFTISSDISVAEYLEAMGVEAAFNVGEFGKLTKQDKMRVSGIKHKAVIEVTTQGTTGVAATGVEIGVLSANFNAKTVRIDKPFLFFIRDRRSENMLFVGNVKNPLTV